MNSLERALGVVAPGFAARRARSRAELAYYDSVVRSYEGAKLGRRTDGWMTPSTGPNAEVGGGLERLRNRSRDMVRSNVYARRARNVWVANGVGDGIAPRLTEAESEIFKRWSDECETEGREDFYGLQSLVTGTEWESGECLVRMRTRRPEDGLQVPFQLQVLEPDHLDLAKTTQVKGGNLIIQGVEYDAIGRRVAYWLFPTHPGDTSPFARGGQSVRVDASEVLHIYRRLRPGQVRGVPVMSAALMLLRDMADYTDAEMMRKKLEACFAVFVTTPEAGTAGPVNLGGSEADKNGASKGRESLRPGMIERLNPGEAVNFAAPEGDGSYESFLRVHLHEAAAGFDLTYHQLTGDLREANYSSLRAGAVEFRAQLKPWRDQVMLHQFCRPVMKRLAMHARLAGRASMNDRPDWVAPKWEPTDPVKDAVANLTNVRAGFDTWENIVLANSGEPQAYIKSIARFAKLMDDNSIILDSDPRKVSKVGVEQASASLKDS